MSTLHWFIFEVLCRPLKWIIISQETPTLLPYHHHHNPFSHCLSSTFSIIIQYNDNALQAPMYSHKVRIFVRETWTNMISHLTGSLHFLPEQTYDTEREHWLKRISYMKAPTSWKQHTHFCRSLFVRCVCCWVFFSARWRRDLGPNIRDSGTQCAVHLCLCMCVRVYTNAHLRLVVCYMGSSPLGELPQVEPQFQAHAQTKTPSQWVCRAVIGPQLLLGQSYWAKRTGLDSSPPTPKQALHLSATIYWWVTMGRKQHREG